MSPTSPITLPAIWYTSGTPLRLGQTDCAYERWLGYHAGPHGTGYRRQATAIPLATGAAVHDGIELLGRWVLDWQQAHPQERLAGLPAEVTAWAAAEAARAYRAGAEARGLELTKSDLQAAEAVATLITEQATLIEAQVWIYALGRLPVMLSQARLLDVEHEEGPILDCTCGLGDWIAGVAEHAARGCTGICAQGRADAIWAMDDGTLAYEEIKTKATPNYGWEQAWEHSGQLWLNMEAASQRLGRDVSQAFVPVLYKGKRDRVNREDKTSARIQQTPLVYGWFDPGGGMNRPAEWSARYRWVDDWGKGHTLPRTYVRTPIWDAAAPLPAENPNGAVLRPEASRVERWVTGWIAPGQYPEFLQVLGPYPKPRALLGEAQRALLTEERSWRLRVEFLRAHGLVEASSTTAEGTTASDLVSRSWQCTKFGGDRCAFKAICHREPGWEAIAQHPAYMIRTPHHTLEQAAFEAGGVVFPSTETEDEGGDE